MNERGFVFLPRRARRGTGGGVPRFFCGRVGGVRCLRAHWRGGEVSARCSIVALRPVGRIARFAPHLQVAVSATGRAPFRCLLVFTQSHAAELARPRYARTLRDSFVCCGAWVRGTLGALPRENHGDRRDKAAQFFRARQGVKAKAYWRYVEPQTTRHCAKRQAVLARSPPRFSRPGREVRFLHLLVFTQSHAAELARPRYARTLRDSFVCCGAWVRGTLGALPRENHGDRRDKAAQFFRARQGVKAKAYWRYVEPQTTQHCAKRQAVLARRFPRFPHPWQGTEVPAPPTFGRLPALEVFFLKTPAKHILRHGHPLR